MLTRDPEQFLQTFRALPVNMSGDVTARSVFLVAPDGFDLADESASDNVYMQLGETVDVKRAARQHAALARTIRADCPVVLFPGDPDTPDGVFPNNVFATRPGALIVGRMRHAVRRREAERSDIRDFFRSLSGVEVIDLSVRDDLVAELTGSMVIDHARGVGFCGLSERCDAAGAAAMHEAFGLNLTLCFDLAADEYHANVVMASLAGRAAMVAADGFRDPAVPDAIAKAYDGHVLALSPKQKQSYAGNAITLHPERVWMSASAMDSLDPAQRADLERWGFALGTVELDEIEKAGGSLRCCVAEIF